MDTTARNPDGRGSRPVADPRAVLERVLADADQQPDLADTDLRQALVTGLADESRIVRFCSSWAIRLLLERDPDELPGLVRLLAARRDTSDDVDSVLAHLNTRYPHRVRPLLEDRGIDPSTLGSPDDQRPAPPSLDTTTDSLARTLDEIQTVVKTDGDVPTVIERVMDDPGEEGRRSRETTDDGTDETSETTGTQDRATGAAYTSPRTFTQQKREDIETIEASALFRSIREQTGFDDLTVVLPRDGRRYADTIRARAGGAHGEMGVAIRLLDRPDDADTATDSDYDTAITEQLALWQHIYTADGIVTVHDWGRDPRPWIATAPVEGTIEAWEPPTLGARFRCALRLVESVAICHRQGVVHAGIDPGNVVIPGDTFETEPHPQLDNVGLLFALHEHFDHTEYLDGRYTAPEYFDDAYGDIDHSTDIYQLGAVVYRILAGQPPFEGAESDIDERVLTVDPPAPTACNPDLPDAVDEIIGKAMAKQKLLRYETISHFLGEFRALCDRDGYSVGS